MVNGEGAEFGKQGCDMADALISPVLPEHMLVYIDDLKRNPKMDRMERKRLLCVVCRAKNKKIPRGEKKFKKTTMKCVKCNVPLCREPNTCFFEYHTHPDLFASDSRVPSSAEIPSQSTKASSLLVPILPGKPSLDESYLPKPIDSDSLGVSRT
jgi:hypothetical protein